MSIHHDVSTATELVAATADTGVRHIAVTASLDGVPTLRLSPGQRLTGTSPDISLRFASGQDGVQLSADNQLDTLHIVTDPDRRAIYNDGGVEDLGRLVLRGLRVSGVVHLLATGKVRSGHVEVDTLHIHAADARGFSQRPQSYGVEVVQGAFTLWNQQPDITITADLAGLSAGQPGAPVRGGGIFVSGTGDTGGRLIAQRLETGPVFSDAGIASGTPDRISGGVFVVHGAFVNTVRNRGPVITYGANDMVLDNWGTVDHWIAEASITSLGPSAIGFVNFGTINLLEINGPIETFGRGSRGFNVYTGTVQSAVFDRVVTHADGAVGVQLSQPVGDITVRRGIETYGATGDSLVKGVVMRLPATALSIKPGGSARRIAITGGLVTHGAGIDPLEVHGTIDSLQIAGGFGAVGGHFDRL